MKYFTLITLTILAIKASASTTTTAATTTAATALENSANQNTSASPIKAVWEEVYYAVRNLFHTPQNLIKAHLETPKVLSSEAFVTIKPTENICIFKDESDFWSKVRSETDPEKVEKLIFCPEAISHLRNLKVVHLMGTEIKDNLEHLISVLLLRRETLIGMYSQFHVKNQYFTCYNTLWSKVYEDGTWPCNDATTCKADDIKANFATLINSTPACKEVLSDQLTVYADKVAEITTLPKDPVKTTVDVREALLENLYQAPHFSVAASATLDLYNETDNTAVAGNIKTVLEEVKKILLTQSKGASTVFDDAVKCFEARLKCVNESAEKHTDTGKKTAETEDKKIENGEEKKKDDKQVKAKIESTESPTDKIDKTTDKIDSKATETDKTPTKTDKV